MYKSERYYVPIHEKANLTLDEAAAYFNIGRDKIRKLTDDPNCEFVLFVGEKRLIKRRLFEKYLEGMYSI
ncbi:MAG: excisionase [Eubacteriales bacterium]|jgi:excisionase family DNA binding protein|nr:excisionase family DNA-binding protein [Lachnospiraceae bacterium]MDO4422464.1 excisionase [Eubacteriales bacterium]